MFNNNDMEPEYIWTAYDFDIPRNELIKYRGKKIGFLLNEGFVLKNKPKTSFILGRNSEGKYLTYDLSELGSVLIAGEDGSPLLGDDMSGRYNFTESLVMEYLVNTMPDEDRLILIGNRSDWFHYRELPSPFVKVIDDPVIALESLNKLLYRELVDRHILFENTEDALQDPVGSIREFNNLIKKKGGKEMPYIMVVINELEDLMGKNCPDMEETIGRLANLGKSVGIFLVICTRKVSGDILTEWIKKNIPARIVFRLKNKEDSITMLETPGAEDLKGRGDMLFQSDKGKPVMHLQAALLGMESMDYIIWHYTKMKKDFYG